MTSVLKFDESAGVDADRLAQIYSCYGDREADRLICDAMEDLALALARIARRWPAPRVLLFTVFLAPEGQAATSLRQPDGVVTHPDRPPYHLTKTALHDMAGAAGLTLTRLPDRLPRGQVLWRA
jgi:hypothetical protein